MGLSNLCLECGLCCDGSLFQFVAVPPWEAPRLQQLGLPLQPRRDRLTMPLPCGRLEGRCCSIYEARPSGCRAFVCALGKRLEAGALSEAEALEVVRQAQARVEAVRAALPTLPTLSAAQQALGDPAVPLSGPPVEAIHAALTFLRAHFG